MLTLHINPNNQTQVIFSFLISSRFIVDHKPVLPGAPVRSDQWGWILKWSSSSACSRCWCGPLLPCCRCCQSDGCKRAQTLWRGDSGSSYTPAGSSWEKVPLLWRKDKSNTWEIILISGLKIKKGKCLTLYLNYTRPFLIITFNPVFMSYITFCETFKPSLVDFLCKTWV